MSTPALKIQSIIARAVDADSFAVIASIELSAALDLVSIDLLMQLLKIIEYFQYLDGAKRKIFFFC